MEVNIQVDKIHGDSEPQKILKFSYMSFILVRNDFFGFGGEYKS